MFGGKNPGLPCAMTHSHLDASTGRPFCVGQRRVGVEENFGRGILPGCLPTMKYGYAF